MSEHDSENSSFIKTPKQLIAVVVLAFVVPIAVISVLASLASRAVDPSATGYSEEAIAKRLKPVGEVVVAASGDTAAVVRTGQQVVEAVCVACHATGTLNAPKIGDTAAWAKLIKEGHDHLTETAIKGIRQMPPKGGNPELTDIEVARAVAYMANQSGAKFSEPAPPAGATPATTTPTSPANPATVASAAAGPANAAPAAAAAGGGDAANGKTVYEASCVACHGAGVAGAPKLGDKAAWAPRLKQGMPALYESSLKGKGAMPPKGGNMALSEPDVKAAVDFLASQAK